MTSGEVKVSMLAAGRLMACASDALLWTGHMSLCSGGAWVEVICYAVECEEVGAPFEVLHLESFA